MPSHAVSFDTLQIIDDIIIPTEYWGEGLFPEPVTVSYPVTVHGVASRDDYEKQVFFNETLFLDLRAMKEDVPKNDVVSARHPVGEGARHISP